MWYRADFEITAVDNEKFRSSIGAPIDSEFFEAEDDESALDHAQELANEGITYADIGRCGLKLSFLVEVDEDTETFEEKEKRVIYY